MNNNGQTPPRPEPKPSSNPLMNVQTSRPITVNRNFELQTSSNKSDKEKK